MRPYLVADGLRLVRGSTAIVAGVSASVLPGDRIAVRGANGSGKSTLLATLAGLLPPAGGTLHRSDLILGWVPQRLDLPPLARTTVGEFVATGLVGQTRIGSGADRRADLAEVLAAVGLTALAGRDLARVSGGERQRAALARALVRRPHLLLADEPATGLDADAASALERVLQALPAEAAAVVISHDAAFTERWATQLWTMAAGRMLVERRLAGPGAPP